jgi:hypothetical protein
MRRMQHSYYMGRMLNTVEVYQAYTLKSEAQRDPFRD